MEITAASIKKFIDAQDKLNLFEAEHGRKQITSTKSEYSRLVDAVDSEILDYLDSLPEIADDPKTGLKTEYIGKTEYTRVPKNREDFKNMDSRGAQIKYLDSYEMFVIL